MSHILADTINAAEGFVLIGESSKDRFPAMSYNAYATAGKRFYCLDLDGLPEARGGAAGGQVYGSVAELPEERSDLAVIWVTPGTAQRAVDAAHEAGCTRVWFSFGSGHKDAVAHARELGMEIVEIGRCPVYYLDGAKPAACKAHTLLTKVSGTWNRPPQLDPEAKRRETW